MCIMELVERKSFDLGPVPIALLRQRQSATREPCGIPRSYFGSLKAMTLTIAHQQPIVSLLAGILILIIPRLLN